MVDLDSNPTKLIEIVEIGKQLLMTRGSLTTFSIANDVAKYFAIIPAMFVATYPALGALNIMRLTRPVGHPGQRDLQRAHHHRADPAGAARRHYRPAPARRHPAAQPRHLRRRRPLVPFAGIKLIDISSPPSDWSDHARQATPSRDRPDPAALRPDRPGLSRCGHRSGAAALPMAGQRLGHRG